MIIIRFVWFFHSPSFTFAQSLKRVLLSRLLVAPVRPLDLDQVLGVLGGLGDGGSDGALLLLVAGVGLVGVALGVAQLVELPLLLDERVAVVLALFPQRGRHPLVPGPVGERSHLKVQKTIEQQVHTIT